MKKILILIFLSIFFTGNTFAGQFGAGKINSMYSLKKGFQKYLSDIKSYSNYVYVFAADNDGAWGYSGSSGGNSWQRAREGAVKNCNNNSKNDSCKVFAKGSRIFWKWDDLPDMTFDKSKHIDAKTLNPNVGSGNIKLSSKVKNDYTRFLKNCIKFTKSNSDKKQVCYFAVTKDGKISGSDYSSYGGMVDRKESKQGAAADCMINSNKKRCFLYADEKKVIWKGNTNLSTEIPKTETIAETESKESSVIDKLKELKSMLDEGLISQEQYDVNSTKLLENF